MLVCDILNRRLVDEHRTDKKLTDEYHDCPQPRARVNLNNGLGVNVRKNFKGLHGSFRKKSARPTFVRVVVVLAHRRSFGSRVASFSTC